MKIDDILQEILLRLVDVVMQGGKPEKVIVSEGVYERILTITTMPRCMELNDGVFYIADLPVEVGKLDREETEIWFRIVKQTNKRLNMQKFTSLSRCRQVH